MVFPSLFSLGFGSGFAFIFLASTLLAWFALLGYDKTFAGWIFLAAAPYAFKFLWAPLTDNYAIPYLCRRFGQRRGWALLMQLGLFLTSLGFIYVQADNLLYVLLLTLLMSFFAASQDIVLDAYRIERLSPENLALGTTFSGMGFRLGILVGGSMTLCLAHAYDWKTAFLLTSSVFLISPIVTLLIQEPSRVHASINGQLPSVFAHLKTHLTSVAHAFSDFLKRANWPLIILFIFFFKISDSVPNALKDFLFVDLGYTALEIASVTKAYGTFMMLLGGFVGGLFIARMGLFKGILLCGLLQLLSPLSFMILARSGHDLSLLFYATTLQNMACGMGSTALVTYLSSLCKKGGSTASQYASIYSFSSLARIGFSSVAPHIEKFLGRWDLFFLLVAISSLPLLFIIKKLFREPLAD